MCGIVGFYRAAGLAPSFAKETVRQCSTSLMHRGPDDAGEWIDPAAGIALGHRRLSILDLSSAGHQPMISASERYVVILNGEIYNHLELRKELEQSEAVLAWRGHSDTETLLAAFDRWGIAAAISKCIGMFAFALWDRRERTLTIARDRVGEKPLYYGWQGDVFLFASELKALRCYPEFRADIDRDVLARYLRYGYIAAPSSIFRGIFKLLPGTLMRFSAQQTPGSLPIPEVYWSLKQVADEGLAKPFSGSDQEAIDQLESRLKQSVAMQRVADVPLGAFLSGGIDSSTIVALMQSQSSRPVQTFTIGFDDDAFNEAAHARAVAQHLGTDHTELYVTSREAMNVIPKLPSLYDEPFGDSSAIPTILVSELARQHVTVSLSGDGGDELFGGYTRYQRSLDLWSTMRLVPRLARKLLSGSFTIFANRNRDSAIGRKASRLSRYLSARTAEDSYQVRITQRGNTGGLVLGQGQDLPCPDQSLEFAFGRNHFFENMMYFDTMVYLPDDILTKVDRASMGVSLESRVPMLNHHVIEFAWSLPRHMKVRDGDSKWLLKQLLRRYVPAQLTERPKMGFGVPVTSWIMGPLREWSESHLSESKLRQDGILNPPLVREQWLQHVKGRADISGSIWPILMFQSWLAATNGDSAGPHS